MRQQATAHTVTRSVLQQDKLQEIYHPDYVAKRMEIGAVMAAAPKENVVRETPQTGRCYYSYSAEEQAVTAAAVQQVLQRAYN